jgi:serine/threonine protein kinase
MNPEELTAREEQFTPALLAWDQALAAGQAPPDSSPTEKPTERQELERDVACLRLLRKVLPRPHAAGAGEPPAASPFGTLGRFVLRRELGRGAFGMVFLAYDPRVAREVALKVPRPDALVTPELRERFVREARAAAGLDHPNVVAVHEAGEVGPVCYIASAYCPGMTLAAWLRQRGEPVPAHVAAHLLATLADAIQHAHERGVVHRDLKPGNILMSGEWRVASGEQKDDTSSLATRHSPLATTPKITDFGLAKVRPYLPDGTVEDGSLTETGAVVGTPAYMAPEQAAGRGKDVGPAADIYALGVILYELLTGRPPFGGATALETLEQVRGHDPVSPRRLRPKLPRDLETICLKCLRKEPGQRYARAGALADDLRNFLGGRPIQARPARFWERGLKWARRRPAAAALLAISTAAAVALAAVVWAYNARLRQANADLSQSLARTEEQRRQADAHFRLAREGIDDYATRVSQDKRLRGHDLEPLRRRLLESALAFYRKFVALRAGDAAVRAEHAKAHRRLALLTSELGAKRRAITHYQKARAVFEQLAADQPAAAEYTFELAKCLHDLGVAHAGVGQFAAAEAAFRSARTLQEKLVRQYPAGAVYQAALAGTYHSLLILYSQTSRPGRAEEAGGRARRIREQLVRAHPAEAKYRADLARGYNALGDLYYDTGRPQEAMAQFRKALPLLQRLTREEPGTPDYQTDLADSHNNIGVCYKAMRRFDRAQTAYRKALAVREQLAQSHPSIPQYRTDVVASCANLGKLYGLVGQWDRAEAVLRKGRQLGEQLVREYPALSECGVRLGSTYVACAELALRRGQPQAVPPWCERARHTLAAVLTKEPRHTEARYFLEDAHEVRALAWTKLGRHAEALADWDRALELDDGSGRDRLRLDRALTLAYLGRHAQAVAEANALAGKKPLPGPTLYSLACVWAVSAGAARRESAPSGRERDRRADRYAARAVELLTKALPAGYFRDPSKVAALKSDKDLDPLRQRADFRQLLRAVEKKEDPKKGLASVPTPKGRD